MKKILFYTAFAAILSMEAKSLTVRNSGENVKVYLHTNVGGEHNEPIGTATGHQTSHLNALTPLADLKEELGKDDKDTYIQFMVKHGKHKEHCGERFPLTKNTDISKIADKTIDLYHKCKVE